MTMQDILQALADIIRNHASKIEDDVRPIDLELIAGDIEALAQRAAE